MPTLSQDSMPMTVPISQDLNKNVIEQPKHSNTKQGPCCKICGETNTNARMYYNHMRERHPLYVKVWNFKKYF